MAGRPLPPCLVSSIILLRRRTPVAESVAGAKYWNALERRIRALVRCKGVARAGSRDGWGNGDGRKQIGFFFSARRGDGSVLSLPPTAQRVLLALLVKCLAVAILLFIYLCFSGGGGGGGWWW